MSDTTDKDAIAEYNNKLRQTSGIFGDFHAADFQISTNNPAGVPPVEDAPKGVDYHPEPEVLPEPSETDSNTPEETTPAGPANAAVEEATDPSDGTTQTTVTTIDPVQESAPVTETPEESGVTSDDSSSSDASVTPTPTEDPVVEQSREEKIAAIKVAATTEEVDSLVGDDTRVTVIQAADARKAQLTPPSA